MQRKCACEEDDVQKKEAGDNVMIQRKPMFGAECNDYNKCKVVEGLQVGKQYTDAAIASIAPVEAGTVSTGATVGLLNKHFKEGAVKDAALIKANFIKIKAEMDADVTYVCAKDDGPYCAAEKGVVGAYTLCNANADVHPCVYYYVCGCEERGIMITHELAHHLGFCGDPAYNDQPEYKTLTHEKAMVNADSYAMYARESFAGSLNCIDVSQCAKAVADQKPKPGAKK